MNGTSSFEWILSRLRPERPLRVLDVGCGDCPEAPALLAAGVELTGIDTDERAIVRARTTSPAAAFVCADAATLKPGWSAPFDVVLLRRPELAASPHTWRRIVSSIPSWLSPRGQVIVSTPGPSEAEAAGRWLDEAGLAAAPAVQLGAEEERHVVTAVRPVPANDPTPVVWEDDSEPGAVCDLATGTCTMPASHPEKEEHDGEG